MDGLIGINAPLPISPRARIRGESHLPKNKGFLGTEFEDGRKVEEVARSLGGSLYDLCKRRDGTYSPLAVCGDWGSGKTTFVSLVLEEAGAEKDFLYFDPWYFGDEAGLVKQFLIELGESVNAEAEGAFLAYADSLARIAENSASERVSFLGVAIRELTSGGSGQDSLSKQKAKLDIALQGMGKCKVVVIDNIDRLSPDLTAMMVRLVGSVVAFPNVLYILPFDKSIVTQALRIAHDPFSGSGSGGSSGFDSELYLDKIVPLQMDLTKVGLAPVLEQAFGKLEGRFYEPALKDASIFEQPRPPSKDASCSRQARFELPYHRCLLWSLRFQ